DLHVDDREADQHAGIPNTLHALFDARDVLTRHGAADDGAFELVALAGLVRLELQLHARELTGAAGLLLVRVVDVRRARERLAVGDLRLADVGLDVVGALQDVDLDVEVKLAHALQNGLAALRI